VSDTWHASTGHNADMFHCGMMKLKNDGEYGFQIMEKGRK
jgi:hypothetical protein